MPVEKPPKALQAAASAVLEWLAAMNVPAVLIGGFAMGLVARPRATADVDCLVYLESDFATSWIDSAAKWNIVPRIDDIEHFASVNRVLLLRHETSGVPIDVSIGMMPFEQEVIERAVTVILEGYSYAVLTAEDLLIMKAVAGRSRDWADIETMLELPIVFDRGRVLACVQEFCDLLGKPERLSKFQAYLKESS